MDSDKSIVTLNVEGTRMQISASLLKDLEYFESLLTRWKSDGGEIFVDCDYKLFKHLINTIRIPQYVIPAKHVFNVKKLQEYYGMKFLAIEKTNSSNEWQCYCDNVRTVVGGNVGFSGILRIDFSRIIRQDSWHRDIDDERIIAHFYKNEYKHVISIALYEMGARIDNDYLFLFEHPMSFKIDNPGKKAIQIRVICRKIIYK